MGDYFAVGGHKREVLSYRLGPKQPVERIAAQVRKELVDPSPTCTERVSTFDVDIANSPDVMPRPRDETALL